MQPALKNTTASYWHGVLKYPSVWRTWLYRYQSSSCVVRINVIFLRSFFFVIHTAGLTLFSRKHGVNVQNHHYALNTLVRRG